MADYLQPDELAFAEPHMTRLGEAEGPGTVSRWAEGRRTETAAA